MILKCYLLFPACILSRLYGKVSQRLQDMILQENECRSPNENTALFSQTSPMVLCDFPGPSYPPLTLADHCFGARGRPPASTLILTQRNSSAWSTLVLLPVNQNSVLLSRHGSVPHSPTLETRSFSLFLPILKPLGISYCSTTVLMFCLVFEA